MDRRHFGTAVLLIGLLFPALKANAAVVSSHVWVNDFSGAAPAGALPASFGIDSSQGVFIGNSGAYADNTDALSFMLEDSATGLGFTVFESTFDTGTGLPEAITDWPQSTGNTFRIETSGTEQGSVASEALGFDTESPISTQTNAALIFDFRNSDTEVHRFAADLLDFEGGNGRPAYVGAYSLTGERRLQEALNFGEFNDAYGNNELISFLIESADEEALGAVVFVVGDDDSTTGGYERLAVADIYLQGRAGVTPVPLPASVWLLLSALMGFFGLRRVAASRRIFPESEPRGQQPPTKYQGRETASLSLVRC